MENKTSKHAAEPSQQEWQQDFTHNPQRRLLATASDLVVIADQLASVPGRLRGTCRPSTGDVGRLVGGPPVVGRCRVGGQPRPLVDWLRRTAAGVFLDRRRTVVAGCRSCPVRRGGSGRRRVDDGSALCRRSGRLRRRRLNIGRLNGYVTPRRFTDWRFVYLVRICNRLQAC